MVLLRNHTFKDTFDLNINQVSEFVISDKAFDVQDNLGKIKRVSFQHLQLLHPTDHVLTNLSDINSFK